MGAALLPPLPPLPLQVVVVLLLRAWMLLQAYLLLVQQGCWWSSALTCRRLVLRWLLPAPRVELWCPPCWRLAPWAALLSEACRMHGQLAEAFVCCLCLLKLLTVAAWQQSRSAPRYAPALRRLLLLLVVGWWCHWRACRWTGVCWMHLPWECCCCSPCHLRLLLWWGWLLSLAFSPLLRGVAAGLLLLFVAASYWPKTASEDDAAMMCDVVSLLVP